MKKFSVLGSIVLAGALVLSVAPSGFATPVSPIVSVPSMQVAAKKSTAVASSVSFSAPAKISYKTSATLKGTVKYTKSKKAISKASVTIQRKSGNKWLKVAILSTDKNGAYKYVAKGLTKSVTYRAAVTKTSKYKASISTSRNVTVAKAPPAPSSVSLSAPAKVSQSGTAALNGTVKITKSKAAISKASVTIQRKSGSKWIGVATISTDPKGVFRYNAKGLTKDMTYRATVKKTGKYKASTSSTKKVSVAQVITLSSTGPKTFTSGSSIRVAGSVTLGLYSKQVVFQKSVNGAWTTLKTIPVSATGTFSTSVPVFGAGANQKLRIIGTNAPAKLWSANIYAWYSLSKMNPLDSSKNFGNDSSVQLRGKVYPNSLNFYWSAGSFGGWAKGSVSYNLGYKCTKFESQVGVDDRSTGALSAWSYTVSRDGVESSTNFVGLGKDQRMTADLSSVLRLELSAVRMTQSGSDYKPYKADASWGTPRVLCLGAP